MKILVICQYYYPEEFQINDICRELVKQGHQITVLTGLPNYPTGIIPEAYRNGHQREEFIDGVRIIRCWEIPRKKGIIGLALNYLSFMLSGALKALTIDKNFDVIYIYQLSPVFMAVPGLILKQLTGKKIFLYCCDLWPESLKIMHMQESSLVFKLVKVISKQIYQHCDRIGIQTPAFGDYFEKTLDVENNKLVYIPQFADSKYLDSDYNTQHDGINLVFMGNIGLVQDFECVIKAVKINSQSNVRFKVHIVGDGSYLARLKQLVQENGLQDYFIFYGRRPVGEMDHFYRLADACLLTLKDDSFVGQTVPGKLQGYMAAGKTVIAAIDGPAQNIIKQSKCGLVGEASDAIILAENIKRFVENIDMYKTCGHNGREYFKLHFTREKCVISVLNAMKQLIQAT